MSRSDQNRQTSTAAMSLLVKSLLVGGLFFIQSWSESLAFVHLPIKQLKYAELERREPPNCCERVKLMQDMVLCDAPCCPGNRELEADLPEMGLMVWCEAVEKSETARKRNFRKPNYAGLY